MASLAPNISSDKATSIDHSHTIMTRNYERDDWRILTLNDATEDALSKILRFGFDIDRVTTKPPTANPIKAQLLAWAAHIASEIPGYNNWQEIYDFTFAALNAPDAVPGEDSTHIGTEADLLAELRDPDWVRDYALLDEKTEKAHLKDHNFSLRKARQRQDFLDRIVQRYSADHPIPPALALLHRKIRYAYTLRECLLGQVGYYGGSLELAADMKDEFEYHMYLIHMKIRRPDRIRPFRAPKMIANYITDPTSPLPWNDQFSYSFNFDEFGPHQVPIFGTNFIERKLVEVLRLDQQDKKWDQLCKILGWKLNEPRHLVELYRIKTDFVPAKLAGADPTNSTGHFLGGNITLANCGFHILTLPNIISLMHNETKRKAFYTDFLGLNWSDTPLRREINPFAREYDKRIKSSKSAITYDLAHLHDSDVRDPRIKDAESTADIPALLSLSLAHYYPQMASRGTNLILTPETAGAAFRDKFKRLSDDQLDQLFDNIPPYPRAASRADKLDAIVNQAVEAAREWQDRAIENRRPIYTGTSGHILSYSRIFLSNIDPNGCKKPNHPTLEQLRLTLLAALIGFNQHHTYDECMFSSHGLTHNGVTLEYKDHVGYRDIIESNDPFIRDKIGKQLLQAMVTIGEEAIMNFETHEAALVPPLPNWHPIVVKWFKNTTGLDFPKK